MTQAKHTPLTYVKSTDGMCIVHDAPLGTKYKVRILCETEEQAAFIVRAGNSFYELLEALKRLTDCPDLNLGNLEDESVEALKQAYATIAKAEGHYNGKP